MAGKRSLLWMLFTTIQNNIMICADMDNNQTPNSTSHIGTKEPSCDAFCLFRLNTTCPGAHYLFTENHTDKTVIHVNASDCSWGLPGFPANRGVVYGICAGSTTYCLLRVQVPKRQFVLAKIQRLDYLCEWSTKNWKSEIVYDLEGFLSFYETTCQSHSFEVRHLISIENSMAFTHLNRSTIKIDIEAREKIGFMIKYTSPRVGHIILPNQGYELDCYPCDFWEDLRGPTGHVIMVSFEKTSHSPCQIPTELIYKEREKQTQTVLTVCDAYEASATVLSTSHLKVHIKTQSSYYSSYLEIHITFSFHSEGDQPEKLTNGLFNCSGDGYSSVRYHLDCNMKPECEDGRDETEHCPFSSPGCQGMVASRNKCFRYLRFESLMSFSLGMYKCQKLGEILASVKTRKEQQDLMPMFKNHDSMLVMLGYTSGWISVPFMYSVFRMWTDRTVIYSIHHFFLYPTRKPSRNIRGGGLKAMTCLSTYLIEKARQNEILCEKKLQAENTWYTRSVHLSVLNTSLSILICTQQSLVLCPSKYLTHTFLFCDQNNLCGTINRPQFCTSSNTSINTDNNVLGMYSESSETIIAVFLCNDDVAMVPYTLVCDYRQDCPENSDEAFCEHPLCDGFLCSNGQCVAHHQRCNEHSDCLDDSDEKKCPENKDQFRLFTEYEKRQQTFIDLDGTGYFFSQAMDNNETCPDTHFQCTSEYLYCLPAYTRCNGFSDCVYGEDEQDCDTASCPGFYRCRSSSVCVHEDHLCDGWGQCPQRDDEWLCDSSCPQGCLCQGRSFLCPVPFNAYFFPSLRYLDATGSGMRLPDFENNVYLIRLSLSFCSLDNVSNIVLPNLIYLDLSNNQIEMINLSDFLSLANLHTLKLSNNPLRILMHEKINRILYELHKVDLSVTRLKSFNRKLSAFMTSVKYLNLSYSCMTTIGATGFKTVAQLQELDIRGNPVFNFALDLFSGLQHLGSFYSSNYRLCCDMLLPKNSSYIKCSAPPAVLSSCGELLPTQLYRVLFWSISVFAFIGSIGCLFAGTVKRDVFDNNSNTFIGQLQFANICMGIYVSIILTVHTVFDGRYVQFEREWGKSTVCKIAAVLFIHSSEVSILTICFLTLNLCITTLFPFSTWRFTRVSTAVTCIGTGFAGFSLSIVPFMPGLSNWGLQYQSGHCRLGLFNDFFSSQGFSWSTVLFVVNTVVYAVTATGQVIVYRQMLMYQIVISSSKRSGYSSLQLVMPTTILNIIGWVFIGLNKITIHDLQEQIASIAVLALPLGSGINPLLYLWIVVTDRQKQAREQRLLSMLKSRITVPKT